MIMIVVVVRTRATSAESRRIVCRKGPLFQLKGGVLVVVVAMEVVMTVVSGDGGSGGGGDDSGEW